MVSTIVVEAPPVPIPSPPVVVPAIVKKSDKPHIVFILADDLGERQ